MSYCTKCGKLLGDSEHVCQIENRRDATKGASIYKPWVFRILLGAPAGYYGGIIAILPVMLAAMVAFSATQEQMEPWEPRFLVAAIILGPAYFIGFCKTPEVILRRATRLGLATFVADIVMVYIVGLSDPASVHPPNPDGVRITIYLTVLYTAVCFVISRVIQRSINRKAIVGDSVRDYDGSKVSKILTRQTEGTAPSVATLPSAPTKKTTRVLILIGIGIAMFAIIYGAVSRYKKIHAEEVWDAMRTAQVDVVLHTTEPNVPCTRLTPGYIWGGTFDMRDNESPTKYHIVQSMQQLQRGQDWFELTSPMTTGVQGDAQRAIIKIAESSYGIDARSGGSYIIKEENGAVLIPNQGHTVEECHSEVRLHFTPFQGSPIPESTIHKLGQSTDISDWGNGTILGFRPGESLEDAGKHAGQIGMTQFGDCTQRYYETSGSTYPEYLDCRFSGPAQELKVTLYRLRLQSIEYDFRRHKIDSIVHLLNQSYGTCAKDPILEELGEGNYVCDGPVGRVEVGHPVDLAGPNGTAYMSAVLGPPSAVLGRTTGN